MKKNLFIRVTAVLTIVLLFLTLRIGFIWVEDIRAAQKEIFEVYSKKPVSLAQHSKPEAYNSDDPPKKVLLEKPDNEPQISEPSQRSEQVKTNPFQWIDDEPVMPVCANMERLLFGKIGDRLQKEAREGGSQIRKTFGNLFKLTAETTSIHLMFRLPHSRNLILWSEEEKSLLGSAQYANELYLAKKELEENLQFAKDLENRAYRSYFMGKILLNRPDLIGDAEFLTSCREIEDTQQRQSIDEMNQTVFELLKRAQISSDELGFDPNWESDLTVKWEKSGPLYRDGLFKVLK